MDTKRIENISKALADETRLRIFAAIAAQDSLTSKDLVGLARRCYGDDFTPPQEFAAGGVDRVPQRRAIRAQPDDHCDHCGIHGIV
jgi:hypothetical protein